VANLDQEKTVRLGMNWRKMIDMQLRSEGERNKELSETMGCKDLWAKCDIT